MKERNFLPCEKISLTLKLETLHSFAILFFPFVHEMIQRRVNNKHKEKCYSGFLFLTIKWYFTASVILFLNAFLI